MGVVWLVVPGAVLGAAAVGLGSVGVVRHRWLLLPASLAGSSAALLLVTSWLLADPGVAKADALKTGGLAGGAILALYALWINDRRRKTEEARQEIEQQRAQLDRDRVSDERFAKAIELLGHAADQVRVGALHALAGLARSRPTYTQTVLDVLCSYLRRPFHHPSYKTRADNPHRAARASGTPQEAEALAAADLEQEVRQTAQRLIAGLLPSRDDTSPTLYDLDLSAATLEYLDLTGRQLGALTARRARLYGITRLSGVRVTGPALFTDATFHGRTELRNAVLDGGLSLLGAEFGGEWELRGALVRTFADLRTAPPSQQLGAFLVETDTDRLRLGDHQGWATVRQPDPDEDEPETPS
ncbi:hypothetical protein F0L68_03780 [Solihabitans fulvus]|uniref:Pentapeptide repeat-containing protein n=1 Tax=Solihabitans fulvus TaxID=1892852 RepID=A0A5B2XS57_9PSEU|nr:pentapeptide repeat-containing protein [Solihabitans fulvus]KAA2265701.1 hypothetical protein F0L68_03780 [Solihabitans fulvus]